VKQTGTSLTFVVQSEREMMAATRQREICDSSIKLPLGACTLSSLRAGNAVEEWNLHSRCTGEAATRSGLTNREPTISKPANAALINLRRHKLRCDVYGFSELVGRHVDHNPLGPKRA
jgi:hypothetical protein